VEIVLIDPDPAPPNPTLATPLPLAKDPDPAAVIDSILGEAFAVALTLPDAFTVELSMAAVTRSGLFGSPIVFMAAEAPTAAEALALPELYWKESAPAPAVIDELSVAVKVTPLPSMVETELFPSIRAWVLSVMTFTAPEPTAAPPRTLLDTLPPTPTATVRMVSPELADTSTAPLELTVESLMSASTVLSIVLLAIAAPVALPLVAMLTWPAPVSMVDLSVAVTVTPSAEISWLFVISASVVSVIVLLTVEPVLDDDDPTEPPAATAVIVASDVADTLTAPVLLTVELSMEAATVFLIVLVALAEPTALPPVAMLTWPEPVPIIEVSLPVTLTPAAETSWLPSVTEAVVSSVIVLVTVDPPSAEVSAPLPPAATAMIVAVEAA